MGQQTRVVGITKVRGYGKVEDHRIPRPLISARPRLSVHSNHLVYPHTGVTNGPATAHFGYLHHGNNLQP